jgi:hypothetical protein
MFLPTWPIERIVRVAGRLGDKDNIRVFLCLELMRTLKDQRGLKSQYHRSASQSLQSHPVPSKIEEGKSFLIELSERDIVVIVIERKMRIFIG